MGSFSLKIFLEHATWYLLCAETEQMVGMYLAIYQVDPYSPGMLDKVIQGNL